MAERKYINIADIWKGTQGGRSIIEDLFPASKDSFTRKKNFRIRPDDKQASVSVFMDETKNFWFMQDKGGGNHKARNAITLLREERSLSYFEALKYAWERYCNGSLQDIEVSFPEPKIEKIAEKYDKITVKEKEGFTEFELDILGPYINADHCKDFNLVAVDYYFTREKNGQSHKICSTPDYPIYYYNYKTWGKIYQPFSKDYRFIYVGDKPGNFLFADKETRRLLDKVRSGQALAESNTDDVLDIDGEEDPRLDEIILCTGPSDAINVYSQNYRVCWLNSETAKFTSIEYTLLKKISKEQYVLGDIDKTGIRETLKIAVEFLEIKIIWLPDDLTAFKDWKGKPCKDIRDFFKHYYNKKYTSQKPGAPVDNQYYFKKLVQSASPLRFWDAYNEFDAKGKFKGIKFDINNEQCYRFLQAHGFYTLNSKISQSKRDFSFIKIENNTNIVCNIKDDDVKKTVNAFLADFVRNNLEYYNIKLLNSIHRSKQVNFDSLTNLDRIEIDFTSHGTDFDHVFFTNCAVRVGANGYETFKYADIKKHVWDFKILNHNFKTVEPMFDIDYSPEYKALKNELIQANHSDDIDEISQQLKTFPKHKKFILNNRQKFSFSDFIYNTGRVHHAKEKAGIALSPEEQQEHDMHFISKVAALGYAIFKQKTPALPFALYAMETKQGDIGTHMGGTGKSIYMNAIERIRNMAFIEGQRIDAKDDIHLFSDVVEGVTDFVYFDDLAQYIDLHVFLPYITGKMTVKSLFKNKYTIDYDKSPKIGISSNHPIRNFDGSLRRRLWLLGFSDYYHAENRNEGLLEFNPYIEFGKNLITDYNEAEMNTFYNFMIQCIQTFIRFNEKIEPNIEALERRNIQNMMGDEFIMWAEDYFNGERINSLVEKQIAFDAYKEYLPEKERKSLSPRSFKKQLLCFANYNNWLFNPPHLLTSPTERERNQIKRYNDEGKQVEYFCFHIPGQKLNILEKYNISDEPFLAAANSETSKYPL